MELKYNIKFDFTEQEKKEVMVTAIYCELQIVVILMCIAGCVGVTVSVCCGWLLGMVTFMFITAVILMIRGWLRGQFVGYEIDKLVKRKLAEQV